MHLVHKKFLYKNNLHIRTYTPSTEKRRSMVRVVLKKMYVFIRMHPKPRSYFLYSEMYEANTDIFLIYYINIRVVGAIQKLLNKICSL